MALSKREMETLVLVCNTIIPSVEVGSVPDREFWGRRATDLGVHTALGELIETRLDPSVRSQFHRLLHVLDSRTYNLLLQGRPVRFTELKTLDERTAYLQSWRDSRLEVKRRSFQALKRLSTFLFYTVTGPDGSNPNWSAIGYPGPQARRLHTHPEHLRIEPETLTGDSTFECDACVVGSGAGGSVVAKELSEAGYRVMVVEAGPYATSESFDQEELSMMNKSFDDHGTMATRDLSFVLLAGRGAGGGTTVNWMTCIRPADAILKNWEEEFGIGGLTSPEFRTAIDGVWNTLRVNPDESQMNVNNEVLWRGCRALGYREGPDFERIWRNAVGCGGRCAFCTYGCVYSCKQSTLLNYLPMAFRKGARFLFNTAAERVIVEGGRATGVECTHLDEKTGRTVRVLVKSKVVVAACGSVKTPALLLRSGIKGKNVGRNLRLHPTTALTGSFEEVRAWDGPPQTVVVTKFLNLDNTGRGFWMEAAPAHPGLFALSTPWRDGASHKEFMKERFNRSTANIVLLKEWGSGEVGIDRDGAPVVSYSLTARDRVNMVRGLQETARILVAAGATGVGTLHSNTVEVRSLSNEKLTAQELDRFFELVKEAGVASNSIMLYSAHHMGSCRMASQESLGAVDQSGEVFGVRNLFVADASVFPTTLGSNPMITVMAMAKRTSGFVSRRLAELGGRTRSDEA